MDRNEKFLKKNPDYHKIYYKANKEKLKANMKLNYKANKEERLAKMRLYNQENKESLRTKATERCRQHRLTDPIFKLKNIVRTRIYYFLKSKGFKKISKSTKLIGCSYEILKEHIENMFEDGMTWENHGEWHIDHIIPLNDCVSEAEINKLCNYLNLQPLWAEDNLKKGAKTVKKNG